MKTKIAATIAVATVIAAVAFFGFAVPSAMAETTDAPKSDVKKDGGEQPQNGTQDKSTDEADKTPPADNVEKTERPDLPDVFDRPVKVPNIPQALR